ncbi:protein of unknown function (DUF3328) domain containing protein [Rhypophila sp. PSN 637]
MMAKVFRLPRWGKTARYQKVEDDEESRGKSALPDSESDSLRTSEETINAHQSSDPAGSRQRTSHAAGFTISLIITNLVTLALWLSSLHRIDRWLRDTTNLHDERAFLVGPAQVPISYETRRFSHIPLERGPGGAHAADEFWHKVVSVGLTRLTTEQAALGGLGDGKTSREWNTTDSYVGVMGTFHQLHCLARARYAILFPGRMKEFDGERTAQIHLAHCLDYLRQIIMCHGDVTIEPVGWDKKTLTYIAEPEKMQVVRQCRNFDEIYEWAVDDVHQVPQAPGNAKGWEEYREFEKDHPRPNSKHQK